MQLDKNLITVLEMMMTRIVERGNGAFGIPGTLAPPDELSQAELTALKDAGFKWKEDMYDDDITGGWLLDLYEVEDEDVQAG